MSFTYRRDLWIAVLARAVGLLGDEMAAVALLLRLQSHGGGSIAVAGLLLAGLGPLALFGPVAGRLVDRADSRVLLVAVSAGQAGLCAALAFVTSTPAVLGLVFALGTGEAVTSTTWQALLPAIAPDAVPRALGLSQTTGALAAVAAPALGGVLTGAFGARVPLLLDAGTFAAVALATMALTTRRRPAARGAGPDVAAGFSMWRDPVIRALLILLPVFVMAGAMVNVVEVFLVRGTLHASATWYGLAGAAWAVGLVGGGLLGGRLAGARSQARGTVLACIALALVLVAMGLAPAVWVLLPISVLGGVANAALNVTSGAQVLARTPVAAHGRVLGTTRGIANSAQIGAYLLGGLLGGLLDPRAVFVLAGGVAVVAPLLLGRAVLRAADTGTADCAAEGPITAQGVAA